MIEDCLSHDQLLFLFVTDIRFCDTLRWILVIYAPWDFYLRTVLERYHLRDFRGGDRPEGAKELFNYRHSSLRNVIERCFGVLKTQFPVLKMIPRYKPCRQGNVMRACCTIHNFIRMATRNDRLFTQFNIDNLIVEGEGRDNSGEPSHTVNLIDQPAEVMAAYRDQIAGLKLANNRHH
ncbi:hypothetical protein SO802_008390 [Lithocarpus litseifolius]|uniref:DDE Tnp4 domain-containing protein n=1 Tax=Lithocarpus litseifolius TaxID=425828 RepID=A0AAW2D8I2_9ROSI